MLALVAAGCMANAPKTDLDPLSGGDVLSAELMGVSEANLPCLGSVCKESENSVVADWHGTNGTAQQLRPFTFEDGLAVFWVQTDRRLAGDIVAFEVDNSRLVPIARTNNGSLACPPAVAGGRVAFHYASNSVSPGTVVWDHATGEWRRFPFGMQCETWMVFDGEWLVGVEPTDRNWNFRLLAFNVATEANLTLPLDDDFRTVAVWKNHAYLQDESDEDFRLLDMNLLTGETREFALGPEIPGLAHQFGESAVWRDDDALHLFDLKSGRTQQLHPDRAACPVGVLGAGTASTRSSIAYWCHVRNGGGTYCVVWNVDSGKARELFLGSGEHDGWCDTDGKSLMSWGQRLVREPGDFSDCLSDDACYVIDAVEFTPLSQLSETKG